MKSAKIVLVSLLCLGLGNLAHAIGFDLHSSSATLNSGNLVSDFYQVNGAGTEADASEISAGGLFSTTVGGNANVGFWVKISFDGNPQPFLTSAFIKAGNDYLLWDAADLVAFNAGVYDSITLWNDVLENGLVNTNSKFKNTSHAGLTGRPGTSVPDGGATAALLGLGLIGLYAAKRRQNAA